MGKTSKPLFIEVTENLWDWPEIQALREQGHSVTCRPRSLDLSLGEDSHRMDDSLRKWLPEAIQEARRRKYPPGKKAAQ